MTAISWSDPVVLEAAVDVVLDVAFDVDAVFEEVVLPVDVTLLADVALSLAVEVAFDMSDPVALPLVDVLSPNILQSADAVLVSLFDEVDVSFAAAEATSVSVMTVTETVGVPSVALSIAADWVWPLISAVPTSQTTRPLNRLWTSAIEVLSSVALAVAFASSFDDVVLLAVVVVSSVVFCASSSNVVMLLSSVCAYIEMPAKAVDTTATADKSDSNVNFVFRSLNTSTHKVCH